MLLRSQLRTGMQMVSKNGNDSKILPAPGDETSTKESGQDRPDQLNPSRDMINANGKRISHEIELERPRKSARFLEEEVGIPSLYSSTLPSLVAKWGQQYIQFGKLFFYLHNQQQNFFAPANDYRAAYMRPEIENNPDGKLARFYNKLDLSYVDPKSSKSVYIGTMKGLEEDSSLSHYFGSLIHLPSGDNRDIFDEEDLASLAISEFCFRFGLVVNKDENIARALANFGDGHTNTEGYGESMNVALGYDDYSLFKFLKNQGDFACYESNHIGKSALEQAAMLPDQKYFNELLSWVFEKSQSRHLIAMAQAGRVCINDNQRAAILDQIERLR